MSMHWKTRGRLYGCLIVALSFVNANADPSISPASAAGNDPIIEYATGDTDMTEAQDAARQHLGAFMERFIGPDGLAPETAAVKIAVPLGDNQHEIIWVSPFGRSESGFVGRLASAPAYMEGAGLGDLIEFDDAQIRDWYFIGDDGLMYGSFTTRIMLADMSPANAAQVAAILSPSALPEGW